ncbi:CGNR zinc finger domain-containing protein [Streptomyces sp. NPDC020917]|uniref:CGNR zinc finger domain-containing protein n=1 Tax=Streptomyces sp. NPDC020917 TaxID=3365102 RepID=UPI0037B60972
MSANGPGTAGQPPHDASVLPGEPLPVQLMNTVRADAGGVGDFLRTTGDLRAWLAAIAPRLPGGIGSTLADPGARPASAREPRGPAASPSEDGELAALLPEFRRLRDALRALAAAATHDSRPAALAGPPDVAAASADVDRACALAPSWSRLSWPEGGTPVRTLSSAHSPAAAALSLVAEDAARLFAGDDRHALRACLAPGCVLYFLGTHPRRAWCSAGCGNRARVARHYQRHHARPGG